jgi:nitrilase
MKQYPRVKVAVMHVAPVFLNTAATIEKACSLIAEAAANGARLITFPEAFVSAFPLWAALRSPLQNHDYFRALSAQAVQIPGPEIDRIRAQARQSGVYVSIGINEGTDASVGCIWNTNVLIDDRGRILNRHRKLMPTFWEKLVWAGGDGSGLRVSDTEIGRLGALICGENINPLARFTLMAQGEQLHISTFPPIWPAQDPANATAYDVAKAIRIRACNHSFEGKLFNICNAGFLDKPMRDALVKGDPEIGRIVDNSPLGVSLVIGPTGEPISEEMREQEGILYAEVDLADCVVPKQLHDVVGYYNRFDIFRLTVDRSPLPPATFTGDVLPVNPALFDDLEPIVGTGAPLPARVAAEA